LEVTNVGGRYAIAVLQGGGRDQQVLESNGHSLISLLLSICPASLAVSTVTGWTSVADQFVDECLPAFPPFFVFGR
jgi:hypothetical protein